MNKELWTNMGLFYKALVNEFKEENKLYVSIWKDNHSISNMKALVCAHFSIKNIGWTTFRSQLWKWIWVSQFQMFTTKKWDEYGWGYCALFHNRGMW